MAGGNFDTPLNIGGTGRVEWPQGPLTLLAREKPLRVEAWITQASTGSAQSSYAEFPAIPPYPAQWVADDLYYRRGNFEPGPAVGRALLFYKDANGHHRYFFWEEDPIELQLPPPQ
jgi:hypothetical protein